MKLSVLLSLLILLLVVTKVQGIKNYTSIFTMITQSSTDNALGEIGTANIYNLSPLGVWSNPAKLGYHKGVSFGYSIISWFDEIKVSPYTYLNASYMSFMSFGWNGIGIMVPLINGADELGYTLEYDELDDTYQEVKTQPNRLEDQLEDLQCEEKIPNMTYSDIFNSSTILSAWMADQSWVESVQGSYRDSIRNDVDSKIHAIRYISSNDNQPHVEHFVVYFDELEWEKGVFWIAGQCWLDK